MALVLNGSNDTITGLQINSANIVNGSITADDLASGVGGKFASYAIICDQKTQDTPAGAFTSGDWRTRDLNTELIDADGIVSISSNQFTLQAGTYLINAIAPAYLVYQHMIKLYQTSGTPADIAFGTSGYGDMSVMTFSFLNARVTLSGATTYEIRHKCSNTKTNNGFGVQTNMAAEIYAVVKIFKES